MMPGGEKMDNEQEIIAGLMSDAEAAIAAGNDRKAMSIYSGVLALNPDHLLALRQLGVFALNDGRPEEAIALFDRAAKLNAGDPDLYHGIATALLSKGALDEATLAFEAALKVDPRHHPSLFDLAVLWQKQGQLEKADAFYAKASTAKWDHYESIFNRGVVLFRQDRLAEAERWFHHAGLLRSSDPRPFINLAMIYRVWGHIAPAIKCLEQALQLDPASAESHWNLANALLVAGDLKRGFAEYEWRFRRPGRGERPQAIPRWKGEPLTGKTILLTAEQGMGDVIHFARFAADLAARGARVVLECHLGLEKLLATAPGVTRVVTLGTDVPEAHFYLPLMSAPNALGIDAVTPVPPYLTAPVHAPVTIRSGTLNVGVVWRGNPMHENDRNRSLDFSALTPLWSTPGVTFYSLQMGETAPAPLVDLTPAIRDFADTAALVSRLDLVIAVDTAVAHLAGAMGKPCWILLPRGNDWRWFHGREDSPWYESVRLFRQAPPRRWEPAVAAIAAELSRLAAS